MWTAVDIPSFRKQRASLKGSVALVPTMGALHRGHLSLLALAKANYDHVIVSIFVNPTQFAPHEDFDKYPRPIERDLALCQEAGVAGVFNPAVEVMYPQGLVACEMAVPVIAKELEGESRPNHFAGVCRVVTKLFNIIEPDAAVFGQKDLQQLLILSAMVADLNFPIEMIAGPTLREADGLAMSSRNVYLSDDGRRHALGLAKALAEARVMVRDQGESDPAAVEAAMARTITAHHMEVDYAVVRHARTLAKVECVDPDAGDGVAAILAARIDGVRLIDNAIL